jgi:hypothetical protein
MNVKKLLALFGATVSLVLVPAGAGLAASTIRGVVVRIEGVNKTLLGPTAVTVHSGWITKGGTPRGQCSATTAAGALDVATHHRWGGSWDPKYAELSVTSIFGEHDALTSPDYWSVWVDNAYAQSGVCGLQLHSGEQLLFAAIPGAPQDYPVGIVAPRTVVAGRAFTVKVVWFNMAGKAAPLASATVTAGAVSAEPVPHSVIRARTNAQGVASLTEPRTGLMVLGANKRGYIRAAPVIRDVI